MVGSPGLSPHARAFVPTCARTSLRERERAPACTCDSPRALSQNPVAACTPPRSDVRSYSHPLGLPVDEHAHAGLPACVYPNNQRLRAVSGLPDRPLSDLTLGNQSQGGNLTVEGPRVPSRTLPSSPVQLDLVPQDDRRYNQFGFWLRPDQERVYPMPGGQPAGQPRAQGWGSHVVEYGVPGWVPGRQWAGLGPPVPAPNMSVGPPNHRAQGYTTQPQI